VLAFIAMGPLVAQIYFRVVYQETFSVFLLAIFLLFFVKGYTGSTGYIVALLLANMAIYCKETNFLPFLTIGLVIVIFNWENSSKKLKIFSVSLIISSLFFLLVNYLYYQASFTYESSYLNNSCVSQDIISGVLKNVKNMFGLPIILAIVALVRFYKLIKNDRSLFIYDVIFFSGLSYFAGYFAIKFTFSWYFVPGYLLVSIPLVKYMHQLVLIKSKLSLVMIGYFSVLFVGNGWLNINSIYANQVARQNDMVFVEKILDVMESKGCPLYTPFYHKPFFNYLIKTKGKWNIDASNFIEKRPEEGDVSGVMFGYVPTHGYVLLYKYDTSHYDWFHTRTWLFAYIDKKLIEK
jgi:hypothetical protein